MNANSFITYEVTCPHCGFKNRKRAAAIRGMSVFEDMCGDFEEGAGCGASFLVKQEIDFRARGVAVKIPAEFLPLMA